MLDDLNLDLGTFPMGGKEGEGYDYLSLQMVEDKTYGNPNPRGYL